MALSCDAREGGSSADSGGSVEPDFTQRTAQRRPQILNCQHMGDNSRQKKSHYPHESDRDRAPPPAVCLHWPTLSKLICCVCVHVSTRDTTAKSFACECSSAPSSTCVCEENKNTEPRARLVMTIVKRMRTIAIAYSKQIGKHCSLHNGRRHSMR